MMDLLKKFSASKNYLLSKIITLFSIDANRGLGKPLFETISGLVPSVNVDLLCYDDKNRFALVYREDKFYGPGWHIPGGVLRFKENLEFRLVLTAKNELNIDKLECISRVNVAEIFATDRDIRGHFISFLYKAKSDDLIEIEDYNENAKYIDGSVAMFYSSPRNIIKQHRQFSYLM